MMKRMLTLFLALLLLLPAIACAKDAVVLNKTRGDHADFAFAPDAKLLEVYFPKIYGCDSALVRYGEYTMLIDCAGNQYTEVDALLKKLGISELTYALNSHPDADHIGGFDKILESVPAGEFLLGFPEDYDSGDDVRFSVYDALHSMNIPFRQVQDGDTIEFGDAKMTIYQRTDESLPRVNNKSVMVMAELGDRRVFFPGDIQGRTQHMLANEAEPADLKCDILKGAHHCYDVMQDGFLKMVDPELVISTGGQLNSKGVAQLNEHRIPVVLTSKGIVRLATDGAVWTVEFIQ